MKQKLLLKAMLLLCALIAGSSSVWGADETYSLTPNQSSTGSSATSYITTLTEFTYNSIKWKMNQWNPSTLQIKTNQSSAASEFRFYNTSAIPGRIKQVVITFSALTLSSTLTTGFMFVGGTSEVSGTTGGTNGTWNNIKKTITWTPGSTENYTYFAFYQNGKVATGTNNLASENAIVITYETSSDPAINAENVDVSYSATSGEIPFTISNSVENTHLTASITDGGEWLSNAEVNETNGKVTFTTTANTGAKREGTIHLVYGSNLATKDVKVRQAGLYTVTYNEETPVGGTLVVKNGDDVVPESGAKFPVGTVLTIVTTPGDNYRLKNWQYKKGTGSWISNTSTTTYTIDDNNVAFRANFEIIPEHTATFYINGTKDSEAVVKEGADITFPEVNIAGQKFLGWTTAAIDGTQTTKPTTLVAEATMGNADVDYYAVFGGAINAYFDASDITATPQDGSSLQWTHTATGIYIKLSDGQRYTDGTPNTFTVKKGTSNYLQVTTPNDCLLDKIVVSISGISYKINSVQTGASLSTSGTTQTVTFTADKSSIRCYATKDYQIRATTIAIKAFGYCTTIPTVTKDVTSFGWATYVAPYDVEFPEGRAYVVTAAEVGSAITKAEVTQVPAGTPVLLKDEGTVTATVLATTPAAPATNMLSVCDGTIASGKYPYVLAKNGTSAAFKQWTGEASVLNGRVVLLLDEAVAASSPVFALDGETTGINTLNVERGTMNGEVYNLNGQRVAQPTKGLYIVNGKKVIVK